MKLRNVTTDYDNDVDNGGGYREWWTVSGTDLQGVQRTFECRSSDDKDWLVKALDESHSPANPSKQ